MLTTLALGHLQVHSLQDLQVTVFLADGSGVDHPHKGSTLATFSGRVYFRPLNSHLHRP
jgi:deoxyinosine 3'endonuclease (endonuclease V)